MIVFDDVHKAFGDHRVLDGFSLEMPEGETTVIIGASGAGKSVALKHIVGLIRPDQGRVIVDGRDVQELESKELAALRGTIGYVFQFAALFDSMTVGDNLRLGLIRQGLARSEIEERIRQSLALVDLEGLEGRFPPELSGGMRKRVGIARAIALHPRYILYDEPTTGLDPVTSATIDALMIRAREELGATSVVVTHDMRSAYTVGDRVAMLHEGRVRQVGSVEAIRNSTDPVVRDFVEGRLPARMQAMSTEAV